MSSITPKNFRYEHDAETGVATVTLDRPDRLNALTFEIYNELREVFEALDSGEPQKMMTATGRFLHVQVSPIESNRASARGGRVLMFRDVSDVEKAQIEVRRSEKLSAIALAPSVVLKTKSMVPEIIASTMLEGVGRSMSPRWNGYTRLPCAAQSAAAWETANVGLVSPSGADVRSTKAPLPSLRSSLLAASTLP